MLSSFRTLVPLLGVAAAACAGRPEVPTEVPAACLDLPGTARASLRLAPDGKRVFWYEQVPVYGYEEAWPHPRIARWDLGAAPARSVTEALGPPFRALAGDAMVGVADGGVVLWRAGVAELISEHNAIDHLELLDEGTAVYAAAGAVWKQRLLRTTARRLAAADELLGVDRGSVVVWRGDALLAIDVASGRERALPAPAGELLKVLEGVMIVRRDDGLALQPLTGGPPRIVLAGEWRTYLAPDGVRAWRRLGDRVEAAIVTAGGAESVPGLTGADGLVGFVRLPDRRVVYLVGHDLDGDGEITTRDEHDVCVGPADRPLAITRRSAPLRWQAAVPGIERAAGALGVKRWRFAASGELPRVTFIGADRRRDRARRWADAGQAGAAVADALGDPTIDVAVEYEDGGRALAEWDERTGKRVRWAGTGAALVPDPDSYEVEIAVETLARGDDGLVTCIGSLTNRTDQTLANLAVDCVGGGGDDGIPVFPTTVPPQQVARFAGVVAADREGILLATVHRPASGENLLTYERARAARYEVIAGAAAEVVDRTRLTVWDWSGGVEVGVELWAPDDFASYSDSARTLAAQVAFDVLDQIDRGAFLGDSGAALVLSIHAGGVMWTYDGKHLAAGAPP